MISRDNFNAFLRVAPALESSIQLESKERLLTVYRSLKVKLAGVGEGMLGERVDKVTGLGV